MKKRFGTIAIGVMAAAAMVLTACGGSSSSGNAAPASTAAAETEAAATEAAGTEAATEAAETEAVKDSTADASVEASVERPEGETYDLTFASNHTSGTFYQWAVAVGDIINKYAEGVNVECVATSGAGESMAFMEAGEMQMCGNQDWTLLHAMNGMYNYSGSEVKGIDVMWNSYDSYVQIMVPADSDINTFMDLKDKRVSINIPSNSTNSLARYIFDALGYDIEEFCDVQELSASEATEALQEGTIDALFTGAGLGASNGVELASSRVGLKLVSFTEEEIKTLVENTIFLERTIPADTYAGVAETHTVGGTTVMAVNDDVPDWVVYECVKAINEHVDELASVLAIGAESTAESTAASWANQDSMPVHPGTMAYLKDLGLAK